MPMRYSCFLMLCIVCHFSIQAFVIIESYACWFMLLIFVFIYHLWLLFWCKTGMISLEDIFALFFVNLYDGVFNHELIPSSTSFPLVSTCTNTLLFGELYHYNFGKLCSNKQILGNMTGNLSMCFWDANLSMCFWDAIFVSAIPLWTLLPSLEELC